MLTPEAILLCRNAAAAGAAARAAPTAATPAATAQYGRRLSRIAAEHDAASALIAAAERRTEALLSAFRALQAAQATSAAAEERWRLRDRHSDVLAALELRFGDGAAAATAVRWVSRGAPPQAAGAAAAAAAEAQAAAAPRWAVASAALRDKTERADAAWHELCDAERARLADEAVAATAEAAAARLARARLEGERAALLTAARRARLQRLADAYGGGGAGAGGGDGPLARRMRLVEAGLRRGSVAGSGAARGGRGWAR